MAQFASTLYPQTNPTNAALLALREIHDRSGNPIWADALMFSSELIETWDAYSGQQWHHAMDVLDKILAFSKESPAG